MSASEHSLPAGGLLHDLGPMAIPPAAPSTSPGGLKARNGGSCAGTSRAPSRCSNGQRQPARHAPDRRAASRKARWLGLSCGIGRAGLDELARVAAIIDIVGALTDRRA